MPEQLTKSTPGPWEKKSFDESQLCILGPDKRIVCIVSIGEGSPDGEANADLINAAPELLGALRGLLNETVDMLTSDFGEGPEGDRLENLPIIKKARAIIAKAIGE